MLAVAQTVEQSSTNWAMSGSIHGCSLGKILN